MQSAWNRRTWRPRWQNETVKRSRSAKLDVPLDPSMRTDAALRRILVALLAAMRANEDGTRRDLDPEYLHDFRVAIRRTRSCLGQVKGVLDRKTPNVGCPPVQVNVTDEGGGPGVTVKRTPS